jgi:hypothetical protein
MDGYRPLVGYDAWVTREPESYPCEHAKAAWYFDTGRGMDVLECGDCGEVLGEDWR